MTGPTEPQTPLWRPAPARADATRLQQFLDTLRERHGLVFSDYAELHAWSVRESEAFWRALWDFCGVIGEPGERVLVDGQRMEHAQWFPDGRLNFAENLLRRRGPEEAMLLQVEDQPRRRLSWDELYDEVSRVAQLLRSYGVQPGDRVAGYLPNLPETAIGMLATAAVGAVWTSTSPDFGVESVIERFGQVGPRVLFGVEAYQYNGKRHVLGDKLRRICAGLPSIEHLVVFPLFGGPVETPGVSWHEALAGFRASEIEFEPRGFGDPLCVLYSSGTTGKPKCITHRVGGVLLQHLKEHQLHSDVSHDDRVFYFTTCGWMMWNWLVSALASGATVIFYDGSPFFPDGNVLLDLAQEEGITLFGTSAKYIDELRNRGIVPSRGRDFPRLRTLCSTGSVLVPEAFDWVYENFKRDLCLASISGGTDIISCFVLGNPLLPVYRGECQCRGLGMDVRVFDAAGRAITGEKGELVCCAPFPSQPHGFWGDTDGSRYHKAYYARFDNVWCHGDWVELTPRGGVIVYGRSDATLNPGGVRIGTAEIYRHVEDLPEIAESIAVGQEWNNDVRVILFVRPADGVTLDSALVERIRRVIRDRCSPRHVPARVLAVPEIPRTRSGKITELAVREVIHGRPVTNRNALANPEALTHFADREELRN